MLKKDYTKLYQLQDKFLNFWKKINTPFYLTGGTALGRFYLEHRHSEDLDFFVNSDNDYKKHINTIYREISTVFSFDVENNLFYDDFITGSDNSICNTKINIEDAVINLSK